MKLCTRYGRNGHSIETCYKKHGYPPGYKFYSGKTNQVNNVVISDDMFSTPSKKGQENGEYHLTNSIKSCHTCSNKAPTIILQTMFK